MPSVLSLPKWAQQAIESRDNEIARMQRSRNQYFERIGKVQEENVALLEILRRVRPDLYDMWKEGESLETIHEKAKA